MSTGRNIIGEILSEYCPASSNSLTILVSHQENWLLICGKLRHHLRHPRVFQLHHRHSNCVPMQNRSACPLEIGEKSFLYPLGGEALKKSSNGHSSSPYRWVEDCELLAPIDRIRWHFPGAISEELEPKPKCVAGRWIAL